MERQKQTKQIGNLNGPILAFGGVYSNFQALEELYKIAGAMNIPASNIICTGDIVGYCAEPEACAQFVKDWGIHCIAGNVEIQIREGQQDCGCDFSTGGRCDTFSRQWYPYALKAMSKDSIDWMNELPDFIRFQYHQQEGLVVHGSYFHTSEFIFNSTSWEVKASNFAATQSQLILAGHCGLPFHHIHQNHYWLNPGVIGMPANDGTARVWYMLLDDQGSEGIQYRHQAFFYDHSIARQRMLEKKLPVEYAETLKSGRWDNCEILPEKETLQQGISLSF